MKDMTKKNVTVSLLVTLVLSVALLLSDGLLRDTKAEIIRNKQGEGAKIEEYEVTIEGEVEGEPFQIEVEEQEYTHTELKKIFQEVSDKLDQVILGENESFDRVEKDLDLVTYLEDYPVLIQWQMDSYSVLNIYGEIQEEHLVPEGTLVELRGIISYKEESFVYSRYVRVYPLTREGKDKLLYEIKQHIEQQEKDTRQTSGFTLPESINGMELKWSQKKQHRWVYVLLAGSVFSIYLVYREREKVKQSIKRRREELLRDYPGMISKFTMLLSTGIMVRNAWEKIVQNYEEQKHASGTKEVFEEMAITIREMQGGISEMEAYERFGKRCGVTVYVKFGTLLSQNLRKGSRGLSEILRMEAIQSFENRKNTAKRLGEEAGTKLLLPMLGMLAVVFMIVMVPAFLSMQI